MNERLYCFKINGEIMYLSIKDAVTLYKDDTASRVQEIIQNSKNKRMSKDGFEPGWQENLQAYAGGRLEYDRMLKERGLVEIGKDTECIRESTEVGGACRSDEFIKSALEIGVDLTGNEIEAIKSGEYFDASKCDLFGDEP